MRRLSNTWKILVVLTLLALVFSIGAERILAAPVVPISDEGAKVQPVSPAPPTEPVVAPPKTPAPAAPPDPSGPTDPPEPEGSCEDFCRFLQGILKVIADFFEAFIHAIAWVFLFGANALINAALTFNAQIGQDLIARKGYNIVLGVANMGFLVALVVIAFATMFRQEGFGYKKALPRVIIAALLINFGFSIVTNWFIEPVTLVTNTIHHASGFNPAGSFFNDFIKNVEGDLGNLVHVEGQGDWAGLAEPFAEVLFTFFLDFLAIIVLFAFAAMLWIRYIALVILIILLPLAWVGWIFPNLKVPGGGNPWREWWENFIRWLLFAPFAMFFFWLALSFTHNSPSPLDAVTARTALADIAGMIVILGILVGGLIVSNKMGISGASYALRTAAGGGAWAKAKGGVFTARIGKGVLKGGVPIQLKKPEEGKRKRFRPIPWATGKLKTAGGEKPNFFVRGLTAPVKGVGKGMERLTEKVEAVPWQAAVKEMGGIPTPKLAEEMFGYSPPKFAAAAAKLQGMGLLWEPEKMTQYLAEHWEQVLASFPAEATKERLNLEAKLGRPLKAFRHYAPLFELEDTKEYKKANEDMEASEAFQALDEDGKYEAWQRMVKTLSTGLKRAGKIKEEVDPEEIREAIQKDVEGWLPGKSAGAVASQERELYRVRPEGGDYGQDMGTQELTRRALAPANLEARPEQFNRLMSGGFPEGLRFLNQQREDHLQRLDQELIDVVRQMPGVTAEAIRAVSDGISTKDRKGIIEAVQKIPFPKGDDLKAWDDIRNALPDKKAQERATKLQEQGAEGLISLYNTLTANRRNLFHWTAFTPAAG